MGFKIVGEEQIDFFQMLALNTDWRGVIYGKAESDRKTACGIGEGSGEDAEETA